MYKRMYVGLIEREAIYSASVSIVFFLFFFVLFLFKVLIS